MNLSYASSHTGRGGVQFSSFTISPHQIAFYSLTFFLSSSPNLGSCSHRMCPMLLNVLTYILWLFSTLITLYFS